MPYRSNADLPEAVRARLPAHAQDVFRAAYNRAIDEPSEEPPDEREWRALRVAWAAVKRDPDTRDMARPLDAA